MASGSVVPEARMLSMRDWLICFIAAVGFMFDIYELLMLPLILKGALASLGNLSPGTPEYRQWAQILFFVPAFIGGLLGLYGGYLTDRLGRRRVLTWSILIYAFGACAAGFSVNLPMLLLFRCFVFAGVCVEFVAAVAWLAELFPNPKQRESILGYTQAFSSFGGLLVAAAFYWISSNLDRLPAIYGNHDAWRYTLISGLLPALPLILIRPFLPESPAWQEKRTLGTLTRPSFAALFSPQLARVTIITTIMFACSYAAAFGAIQQLPQIVPAIPSVAALKLPEQQKIASEVQLYQEIGGLVGRFALAVLITRWASRAGILRSFQWPGLIMMPLVFGYLAVTDLTMLKVGIFIVGFLTVGQFSFWGNYLPAVYPLHLRGTGESFAANIGGRILGTSAAALSIWLSAYTPGETPALKLAFASAIVGTSAYALGFLMSFTLPEPPDVYNEGEVE